jgi:hypothetical protein
VRLALALRAEKGFAGDVLVVGRDAKSVDDAASIGDATSLGGFYYLRQPADRVTGVSRDQLAAHLQQVPPVAGGFVVAVRDPLSEPVVASSGRLELVGSFTGYLDLSASERRFLYRWR